MFNNANCWLSANHKMANIHLYETARRDVIRLWEAKRRLLCAAESRFPKSSPVFRAIHKLCLNDPTCKLRLLADRAVCKCADRYGDDLFRKEVDGVYLPAPAYWFYGISDQIPVESVAIDRTKTFNRDDVLKLESMRGHVLKLVHSVSALPFISTKEIAREADKFEKAFAHARWRAAESSPVFTGYLLLAHRLCPGIADTVLAFCG